MSNPTRQEIIEAHAALDELIKFANKYQYYYGDSSPLFQAEDILKALPPKPQPTMDDVDWEHDKHFLAIAEDTRDNDRYIMLFPELPENIRCIGEGSRKYTESLPRKYLVPTGERYILEEGE